MVPRFVLPMPHVRAGKGRFLCLSLPVFLRTSDARSVGRAESA